MNKIKFASLIVLGVFSVGKIAPISASTQGNENLANIVDMSIGSHHESADYKI